MYDTIVTDLHLAEPMECQPQQNIVPQPLIDHFVSMADPDHASSTDIDLAHHCAFSLPAVALTLGPTHWGLLRDTYTTLASDRQVDDVSWLCLGNSYKLPNKLYKFI